MGIEVKVNKHQQRYMSTWWERWVALLLCMFADFVTAITLLQIKPRWYNE